MTGEKNRFKTTEKLWDLDDKQLKSPKHDAMVLWLMDKNNLLNYNETLGFPPHFKDWEYINAKTGEENVEHTFIGLNIESEKPIMSSSTFIAGYADLIVTPIYSYFREKNIVETEVSNYSCLIEVKPYIDSFGAVLRQVKSYGKFWKRNSRTKILAIFTLDNRFDAQFESQGIKVLHPPKDVGIADMMNEFGLSNSW